MPAKSICWTSSSNVHVVSPNVLFTAGANLALLIDVVRSLSHFAFGSLLKSVLMWCCGLAAEKFCRSIQSARARAKILILNLIPNQLRSTSTAMQFTIPHAGMNIGRIENATRALLDFVCREEGRCGPLLCTLSGIWNIMVSNCEERFFAWISVLSYYMRLKSTAVV